MALAVVLAACAGLLLLAAGRELAASRPGRLDSLFGGETRRRLAEAALELGIPARLARAGLGSRVPTAAVMLSKLGAAAVGAITGWLAAPAAPGRLSILVAVGLPAAGFLVPDALLERRARQRRRALLASLPDALDLLAVGSTSGRSPATGFAEIARSGRGPLADELRVVVAELDCGEALPSALGGLRDRVPGAELATLAASIERSRTLGSPLADQLGRQATSLRRDQRRAVEESAARAAPKIQLVVALVLVPSVLLMIAAALIANADVLLAGF
jgi:tight adherence protein C